MKSARAALFAIWSKNKSSLNSNARDLADEVEEMTGKRPQESSVYVYKSQFRQAASETVLSPEAIQAGKQNRNNEQRRKWRIEEAVKSLLEEQASLHEMMAAGMQLVVLKAA